MVKLVDKQNIFNSGILSSKLYSRDDLKQYNNGLSDALNFICSRYGPIEKRTGTEFVCDLGTPGVTTFLLPFIFSIEQTLILEFREYEIRFYTFGTDEETGEFKFAPVKDPEDNTKQFIIGTNFTDEQIEHISYVQSLDVVYIAFADGKTPPHVITRRAPYTWTIEEFETEDGPYLDQNYKIDRTVKIDDTNTTTSTVTLTNFTLNEKDVGRWIRICTPRYNENTYAYEDKWSYGKITGVGDSSWKLTRTSVYTNTTTPTTSTKAYSDSAKKKSLGNITSVSGSGTSMTITIKGKTFKYNSKLNKSTWEWKEEVQGIYVNTLSNGSNIYSDSSFQTAIGTIVPRLNLYTKKSSTNIAIKTKVYSKSKIETNTTAVGHVTDIETINNVKYITVYFDTDVGSTIKKKETRRFYYSNIVTTDITYLWYEETTNLDSTIKVQLNTADSGYTSTYTKLGNSIIVKWSYRNAESQSGVSNDWMTKATSEWRLGVWHKDYGNEDYPAAYPTKVTIHQQRLVWAGMTDRPWVWMSNTFAYKNYAPSDYEGEITDTNAIYYDMSSSKISEIFWIASIKSLLIGTELGEIRLYSGGTGLTPKDAVSNMESSYGCYNADPILNDDNIVYIQRLQRTVRSLSYDYNQDAFVGPELTILAEGLTVGGIKKLAFQKEPNNTYWCLKEDGSLLSLTYDRAQDVIGWSKSEIAGTDVKVIDMAVLPSNKFMQDMLILCVERTVNGNRKRYMELLSRNFNRDVEQKDALFLDCATYIPSATARTNIIGLDYLEGEQVRVIDEGSLQGDYVIENGQITLDTPCKNVWVGLPYEAYLETLERDFQDKQLSTKMSKLRIYKLRMYVERTLGIELNRLENGSITKLITFDPTKNMDEAPNLLTGKVDIPVGSAWDCDYRLRLTSEPGFPCTVAGFVIGVEVNEL